MTKQKSIVKTIIKVVAIILAVLILVVAGYIIYAFASYHRIEDNKDLTVDNRGAVIEEASVNETYTIMTYNIGFGAYESDYSFFMDGGDSSWAKSKDELIVNIDGIGNDIKSVNPDIVILQEVDIDGTRTYHVDEAEQLKNIFGYSNYVFSQNFDSPFLFWPLTEPHGKNQSGLLTCSSLFFSSSLRRSLPVSTSLKRIVDLDRCYSITRIPVENGKELCIFNVHLSAYGSDASVREGQLGMLMGDIQKEVENGNYVICGGDFNHNLRGESGAGVPDWAQPFPMDVLPSGTDLGFKVAEESDIEQNTTRVEWFDTGIAILAGLMIIPAVFAFTGGDIKTLKAGPSLMFITLPKVFDSMGLGNIIGNVFFLMVLFAALTSAISLFETCTATIAEELGFSRVVSSLIVLCVSLILGTASVLGYGIWSFVRIFGMQILDFFDFLTNSVMMPVSAFFVCILIIRVIGFDGVAKEVKLSSKFRRQPMYYIVTKYIAPFFLMIILASSIASALGFITI